MKHKKLKDAGRRGWFIGDFSEAAFQSKEVEICYCTEEPGPSVKHYHTRCTEIVLIISGKLICQEIEFSDGDIIILEPGEINDFNYLAKTEMIGIKLPAGGNDKICI
jgi:quercetin dioxygenase-like cupin family protein